MPAKGTIRGVLAYSTIGLQLAGMVLVFVYGGHWLDERYSTSPGFLVVGTVLGLSIGFYSLIKELGAIDKRLKGHKEEEQEKGRKWL
ncbi:MAG TPA: AtpZ/AtpI family protein [Spirochaetota bacterium]|nr:AtpZ/AtpI family protein [Spirochaetota bacterium]